MEAMKCGADIVTFSGDKLLGGPQAGIIVGRRDLIKKMKANPMKRDLRCDKMTIAALSSLLKIYSDTDRLPERLPVLKMMTRSIDEIRSMAAPLATVLSEQLIDKATVTLVECDSETGSGSLADQLLPSVGIAIRPGPSHSDYDPMLNNIAAAFRNLPIPVIGRIHRGAFLLDCRCLENPEEFSAQLAELDIRQ